MEFVRLLTAFIVVVSVLLLLLGLYKPWVALWWEDVQNRRKVIKLYGTIAIVFGVAYVVLGKI